MCAYSPFYIHPAKVTDKKKEYYLSGSAWLQAKTKEYNRMVESGEIVEEEDERLSDIEGEELSHGSQYAEDEDETAAAANDRSNRDPDAWKQRRKSKRIKGIAEEDSINSVRELPSGETGNTELLLAPPPQFAGKLNNKNYFGAKARTGFFSTYQKIARQYQMDKIEAGDDDDDDDISLDSRGESLGGLGSPGGKGKKKQPLSPRHKFLSLLVADGKHPPIPIIIRHSETDDQLNLAHRSLGDDYIIYLSSVITELPNLTRINLRGNRLTDRGLGVFIDMLKRQVQILEVDLSDNKLDSRSSEALSSFLKTSHCTLQTLRLSSADLDDGETAVFMKALETNASLTVMDLSHNLLGGIGEKSVVRRGSSTGGAAIANAIMENVNLRILDLSWNKLGMSSAVYMGNALQFNNTLLELNLAYNGIKNEGAEAIGAALLLNICLIRLDLSYNGIGANGSIELAVGLRMDEHVQLLNMSGNPIGDDGGRALLQSLNYHAGAREILISDCSFEEMQIHSPEDINLTYPADTYSLDMTKTRCRCIMYELLRQAAVRRGCYFKNMEHKYFPSLTTGIHASGSRVMRTVLLQLVRKNNPAENMGEPYGPWRCPHKRPRHRYTKIDAVSWMDQLETLKLVDRSTGLIYHPPNFGFLTFEFVSQPRCPCPIQLLNGSGQQRLIQMIKLHAKERSSILRMCGSLFLETYQLDEICESLDPRFRKESFQALLPCVRDTSNTWELVEKYAPSIDDRKNIQVCC
jgi:Ran GTPase-activating protein (RanGAP) involved in mRNA processing and transport